MILPRTPLQRLAALAFCALISLSLTACVPVVAVVAGTAVVGANSASSGLPLQTQMDDITLHMKATQALKDYTQFTNHSNIEVTVFNRIVLLVGQVPSDKIRHAVAEKIAHIGGVRVVYNELTVGPTEDLGAYFGESALAAKVRTAISSTANPFKYKVVVSGHTVYLMAITTPQEGQNVAEMASHVSGVKLVVKVYFYKQPKSAS